jgi:DNA-binding Lrp family transcriptional regulator
MTSADLDRTDRAIVNGFQGGFPVAERPFDLAAAALRDHGIDVQSAELSARVLELVESDVLSRFGASIDADALGGATTLVAMSVPEAEFESVVETVNEYREVAHNYERAHELNMWFVLSVVDPERIPTVLDSIEHETGYETYNLPKLTEFDLGARFPVEGPLSNGGIDLSNDSQSGSTGRRDGLSDDERELVVEIQNGLPLTETPYGTLADELGASTDWVVRTISDFLDDGTFRRIGAIPNHYALGYTENPMTVWDIPDSHIEEVGEAVGSLPFVTHCYERPRHGDLWPYNLFAMAHGRSSTEASERVDKISETIEDHSENIEYETLNSTRVLKKTGLRLTERGKSAGNPG